MAYMKRGTQIRSGVCERRSREGAFKYVSRNFKLRLCSVSITFVNARANSKFASILPALDTETRADLGRWRFLVGG